MKRLRIVLIKPSKYSIDGAVERFRWGFMPNSTLAHLKSLTPDQLDGCSCETHAVDEYVQTDLAYLDLLQKSSDAHTLLALVGVQSHQFQRALDLAAFARSRGVESCVIGGPHPMTCDTSELQNRGVSFALAEAELIWTSILRDALQGELRPVYGDERRWEETLDPPVLMPLPARDLRRYVVRMLGIYPARGCPFTCNFCSVIHIAGRRIRSQPVETTMASLKAAKAGGVKFIMFTSDNFNKYPEATELLNAMIAENLRMPFFVQCDAQVYRQKEFIELLGKAGCFQIFVGVESFSREALRNAHKTQNLPEHYSEIISLCHANGMITHFSNILGFPEDTKDAVNDHLNELQKLQPDIASFYILTPIPGTEQYNDFLEKGWITESNLDRFDATQVTWQHPRLSASDLRGMLMDCYRKFYGATDVVSRLADLIRRRFDYRLSGELLCMAAYPVMSRIAIRRGDHPMAGGTMRVRRDSAADYAQYRLATYGISQAPLPRGLKAADYSINETLPLPGA